MIRVLLLINKEPLKVFTIHFMVVILFSVLIIVNLNDKLGALCQFVITKEALLNIVLKFRKCLEVFDNLALDKLTFFEKTMVIHSLASKAV